jgi:hypothetical protein
LEFSKAGRDHRNVVCGAVDGDDDAHRDFLRDATSGFASPIQRSSTGNRPFTPFTL